MNDTGSFILLEGFNAKFPLKRLLRTGEYKKLWEECKACKVTALAATLEDQGIEEDEEPKRRSIHHLYKMHNLRKLKA